MRMCKKSGGFLNMERRMEPVVKLRLRSHASPTRWNRVAYLGGGLKHVVSRRLGRPEVEAGAMALGNDGSFFADLQDC